MSRQGTTTSIALLLLVASVWRVQAQNIDTKQPYIRSSPDQTNVDYFGYSIVLHQTIAGNPNSTLLIVGAPNGTAPGSLVSYTGLIYSCPLSNSGACAGLTGNGIGTDRRLFDTDANAGVPVQVEEKSGQFLGSALVSKGGSFVACGHRYFNWGSNGGYRSSFGRCFISGRSLNSFVEFQPCNGVGIRQPYSVDVCQAGFSAAIANVSKSDPAVLAVGAPGTYTWRGIVIRRSPSNVAQFTANNPSATLLYGYFGYSMTSGYIQSKTQEDYLVSSPDFNNLGSVSLVKNVDSVDVISEPLMGQQILELYGFSVIAADLTGDGYDEVLVGAPLYSPVQKPEAGRVYVYRNIAGSLQYVTQLFGDGVSYGRFGHAMVNLGDINADGFADVAISAPFSSDGGKVYIYNGQSTSTISSVPAQVIVGKSLLTTLSLSSLIGFGASLASQVDVDGNTYNDLAIGSYQSKQVFVLRTRPVAQLSVSLTASSLLVQVVLNCQNPVCNLNSVSYTCFNVSACVTYTGASVANQLGLNVTVVGDTTNQMLLLTPRVFFGTNQQTSSVVTTVTATKNVQTCSTLNVYIQNNIADILKSLVFNMSVSVQDFNPAPSNGTTFSQDLSLFPILSQSGANTVQVQINNAGCGTGTRTPVPDLSIQFINKTFDQKTNGTNNNRFIAQETARITIWLRVSNKNENAFATIVTFRVPKTQLTFIRCGPDLYFLPSNQDECQFANTLSNGNYQDVAIQLVPAPSIDSSQLSYTIIFNVSSQNPEYANTTMDNTLPVQLSIETLSALSIDTVGIVKPEQVILNSSSINATAALTPSIGPSVLTTFTVRNGGLSTIPLVNLDIYWPLTSTTKGLYYLIPTSIKALSSSVFVTTQCNTTYITLLQNDVAGGNVVLTGNKRSADSLRRTRQAVNASTPLSGNTKAVTVDCSSQPQSCVRITCSISQLSQDLVTIVINSTVDSRFFAGLAAEYNFIPRASVSISGSSYISDTGNNNKNALADIVVKINVNAQTKLQNLPWWVYLVIIVPGLLFLLITILLVYVIVHYYSKRRQAIKEKYQDQMALTGMQGTTN